MRCFYHVDRDAVGTCKSCNKGLCSECAVDLDHGLACRGKHEQNVESLNSMVVRATQVQVTTVRAKYVAPAFTAFMGVMFVGYGYLKEGLTGFLLPLGAGFLVYSLVIFITNRRAYGRRGPSEQV
jgi:hypothetical protein